MENKPKKMLVGFDGSIWKETYEREFPDYRIDFADECKSLCKLLDKSIYDIFVVDGDFSYLKDSFSTNRVGEMKSRAKKVIDFSKFNYNFDKMAEKIKELENEKAKLEILVVEDRLENIESAKKELAEYNLHFAENYEDAKSQINGRYFDVVLSDLMMPKGNDEGLRQNISESANEQRPYGLPIALHAAKAGVPYVSIVTDADHHDDPLIWACDPISDKEGLRINGSIVKIAQRYSPKPWGKVLEDLLKKSE